MRKIMLRAAAVGTAMMLTAAGCKQSNDTIYVPVSVDKEKPVPVFTSIEALKTYLEGQQLVSLKLSVDLSGENLPALFAALAAAGKYVDLDLSGCTGLTKWERYTDAGAGRVVSLVLPDSVTEIAEGTNSAVTFASFALLETLTANKAEKVGDYAFRRCAALKTAILPAATVIGNYAFIDSIALTSVSLPQATTIGNYAFSNTALALANLPALETIGVGGFTDCPALTSADLPAATTIEASAFRNCMLLTSVSLPAVATIGANAFQKCAALTSISLPSAATIGASAFWDCTTLESLTLGTTLPPLGSASVFCNVGKDTEGFTIYVPNAETETALNTAIADTDNNWYKALKTDAIGTGWFKGVAVTP